MQYSLYKIFLKFIPITAHHIHYIIRMARCLFISPRKEMLWMSPLY